MSSAQAAISLLWQRNAGHENLGIAELSVEPLRQAVAFWNTIRGDRRFPARSELKPRALAKLMPHMALLKVIDGGDDFEHRIVGDIIVQAFRVPIQNRRFSEIARDAPDFIAGCFPMFRQVVASGAPVAWRTHASYDAATVVFTHSEVVLLPLGTQTVDHIVGFGSQWTGAHAWSPQLCPRD